jgi:sirohydrochlorin cobaltochelatase
VSSHAEDAVLLVGHGSRDSAGVYEYLAFAAILARGLGCHVQTAFLEFANPSVVEGIRDCVDGGAARITIMPLFLGPATHQKNDVPAAIQWARQHYPRTSFVYGAPLGAHALLAEALATRVTEALHRASTDVALDGVAVLLVGRGSHDPDSNSELYKAARLLYEGRQYGWVEACFIAISQPDLRTGIDRCQRLGARCIVVVPYMLFTGTLTRRMEEQTTALATQYPEIRLITASPLGIEPRLITVVRQRVAEARAGGAYVNCDVCKYRVPMAGFEAEHGLLQGTDHHHGLRGLDGTGTIPLPAHAHSNGEHNPLEETASDGHLRAPALQHAGELVVDAPTYGEEQSG